MKEERFEKVVKWEIDGGVYLSCMFLMGLLLGTLFKSWIFDFGLAIMIIFLVRMSNTVKRKVYWRKIK